MYAIIKTGGKQYKVAPGDTLKVESLSVAVGDTVEIDQVLMVADGDKMQVGAPLIDGGKVTGKVVSHGRGNKVKVIKFHRRKQHMKRMGHRQNYTEIEITGIKASRSVSKVT